MNFFVTFGGSFRVNKYKRFFLLEWICSLSGSRSFCGEQAAGGIDVQAAASAYGRPLSTVIQIVPKCLNSAGGAGCSGEIRYGMVGYEIDPRSQAFQDTGEFLGMTRTVVQAVYHQIFDGQSALSKICFSEKVQNLHYRVSPFIRDEFSPFIREG